MGRGGQPAEERAAHRRDADRGEWTHPYRRDEGGYPGGNGTRGLAHGRAKYWPPVRRIDQAYGDRHLVCSCQPPEAYE